MKHNINYLDDNNNFTDRDNATHAIIQELDDEGILIREVYEILNRKEDIKTPIDYMSDEQIRARMKNL